LKQRLLEEYKISFHEIWMKVIRVWYFILFLFECGIFAVSTQNIFLFIAVDVWLPMTVETILQNLWIVLFAVLFVCLVFPWFIIPLLILAVFFYIISTVFR
jgi:hypothetical protein